ncbi:LamG-like jellyroll fold domain-containing protein [Adhaeribacter pallidiroseus]|uniref:LamG-like jellyroll fold domain-containing protein n=1 Tax=Adhaeribacter pallidiroseus TaxID=2072847 RepID=A0A369QAJ5_9BACT|nr:LamG-like jellyroll fold domain-containing protein [Adhaeribacter pallidiroseus]RDC61482.1 hypothetical protein AHMF7616_00061 [Adhaeribacter pallidiroseus]
MKHYYLRFLGFFLFFLGLGRTPVFAHNFYYDINYEQGNGRVKVTVSVNEDDCGSCNDNKLEDLDITYRSPVDGRYYVLLSNATYYNRNGDNKSYWLENGGSGWDGVYDKQVYYINIRPEWMGQTINIKTHYYWGDNDDRSNDKYNDFYFPNLASPTITSASNGEQTEVRLTWDKPATNGYPSNKVTYQVYQNSRLIGYLDYSTTSFTDVTTQNGIKYEYQVKTNVEYLNGRSYTSASSPASTRTAWKNAQLVLTPTYVPCATGITLSWPKPNLEGTYSYKILRSTRSDFSSIANTFEVNGGLNTLTYFDDTNLQHQKPHYYKVQVIRPDKQVASELTSEASSITPDLSPAAPQISLIESGVNFKISWNGYTCQSLTNFKLIRKVSQAGNVVANTTITINGNPGSWVDEKLQACNTYEYQLVAVNQYAEVAGNIVSKAVPDQIADALEWGNEVAEQNNPQNLFYNHDYKFKASKGFFTSYVQLQWDAKYKSRIENYEIYRKIAGTTDTRELVHVAEGGSSTLWLDEFAEANTIYEYTIEGVAACNGQQIKTRAAKALGFRAPFGTVSGRIYFEGGQVVEKVQVRARNTDEAAGKALQFNDNTAGFDIKASRIFWPSQEGWTLETWLRPSNAENNFVLYDHYQNGQGLQVSYADKRYILTAGAEQVSIDPGLFLKNNEFHHVSVSLNTVSRQVQWVINDSVFAPQQLTNAFQPNANPDLLLVFGNNRTYNQGFQGVLDEVRIWNKPRTAGQLVQDYSRFLDGSEPGLIAYWKLNEGFSDFAFDGSRVDRKYNENHAKLKGSYAWTTTIPSEDQLANVAYTDSKGNYRLTNIQFRGSGESFEITPLLGVHTFDPNALLLFIGEGALSHNGKDFKDISSFLAKGSVRYQGTSFPVQGVQMLVDGKTLLNASNVPVMSDAKGEFEARVPIGQHVLSFVKNGHVFQNAYWPAQNQPHDFQEHLRGQLEILDTTKVKLIGRVAGGQVQGDKPLGMGLSKNNLGTAKITLEPEKGGDLDESPLNFKKTIDVTTDPQTGEYLTWIIPERFMVKDVKTNNALTDGSRYTFGEQPILDLSLPVQDLRWEYQLDDKGKKVDSASYHFSKKFVLHNQTKWSVNNNELIGEKKVKLSENGPEIDLAGKPFGAPVFNMNAQYAFPLQFFEEYENADDHEKELVPVTNAKIKIVNNWKQGSPEEELILNNLQGIYNYKFRAGSPNLSGTYTYNFSAAIKIGDQSYADLGTLPGYILGQVTSGSGFVTKGPDVVEFILRDPPGTNSYAYLSKGSTTTKSMSITNVGGSTQTINPTFYLGANIKTAAGFGVALITETDIEHVLSNEDVITEQRIENGQLVESLQVTESWKTSDDPELVGSDADLFVGRAMNFILGKTETLELLELKPPFDQLPHSAPFTYQGKTYALVRRQGIAAAQDNYGTRFMYTQQHIQNTLIPTLKNFRNSLLLRGDNVYVSKITKGDSRFGADNYDKNVFANAALSKPAEGVATRGAYSGPSYSFNPAKQSDPDSVYLLNQQIILWEEALRSNEANKVDAKTKGTAEGISNVSFDGGVTQTWEKNLNSLWGTNTTVEVTADASLEFMTGGKFNGFGATIRVKANFFNNFSGSAGESNTENLTFGYVLSDGDKGDFYSVDVIDPSAIKLLNDKGDHVVWADYYKVKEDFADRKEEYNNGFFSPMFYTRGGQTSCPYEDDEKTRYYQPGKILNAATLRREKPEINVENNVVTGVPETNAAVFKILLQNNGDSEEDIWYGVQVDENSNPNGAIITIDGSTPNRAFRVPPGEVVEKVLTVKKGPGAVFNYENLGIVLHSLCEAGTVADTVKISAFFAPACTPVTLLAPLDNWLVNVDAQGKVPVQLSGYDVNLRSFKSIELQYKSTASNTWATIHTFYNKEADYNAAIAQNKDAAVSKIAGKTTINFSWDITDLPDRNYELRAKSLCTDGSVSYTEVKKGLKDVVPPLVFGAPQPADGILSPNDEIMIQFADPVEAGLINKSNITVRGVLNGSNLAHGAFLHFDGQQGHVRIPEGLQLNNRSFTVEFWARVNSNSANEDRILFTQGTGTEAVTIGFDKAGKLFAGWGSTPRVLADKTSPATIWQHYAVSYDATAGKVSLYGNDQLLAEKNQVEVVTTQGVVYVGYSPVNGNAFQGDVHALRVWDQFKTRDEVYAGQSIQSNGGERGLIGYWPFNDLKGTAAKDLARALHAEVAAQWVTEPASKAISLNGNGYVQVNSGHTPVTQEGDFTLEFWYKGGANAAKTALFSAALLNTDVKWALEFDEQGAIFLKQNDQLFNAVDNNTLDGKWHHLAMVVDRRGNLSFLLDGALTNYRKADVLAKLTVPALYFGVRFDQTSTAGGTPKESFTNYFKGQLDEIRFWNSARTTEQINRSLTTKLPTDLADLQIYYPFEAYQDNSGVMLSIESNREQSGKTNDQATFVNATYTNESPKIDRPQPEQKVDFNYVINNDKLLITLNEPQELVEKTILDITVQGVMDKNSNVMPGAKTWSVFVDKNQVKWVDSNRNFEKEVNKPLQFEVEITNMGGNQESFQINGLPGWLTVSPASGSIEPNSRKTLVFTVIESLNMGRYTEDILLRTNFGYDEKLALHLKVFTPAPEWTVNPRNFSKSMSIIGQVKINDQFSINPDDKVAAFVNGQCRGVARLEYVPAYDRYLFFMQVYGQGVANEKISFQIWNANVGVTHTEVIPATLAFEDGMVHGSTANPYILTANNIIYQELDLKAGWNWISFNVDVKNKDLASVLDPTAIDRSSVFMSQDWVADYSAGVWSPPGKQVTNVAGYLLKVAAAKQLKVKGAMLNPANEIITLKKGWNWIGYTPQVNMPVPDALAGVNLADGDIIKSQTDFAVYDQNKGWVGSLKTLKTGQGYRIQSSQNTDLKFTYPKTSINSGNRLANEESPLAKLVNPGVFRYNMNLVAEVVSDQITEETGILVHNAANGEKVGWGTGYEIEGKILFFITMFANLENQGLRFTYHDKAGNLLVNLKETMNFQSEQIMGSILKPFQFTINGTWEKPATATIKAARVFPNPFAETFTIEWQNNPNETVMLDLYDVAGRQVKRLWSGQVATDLGSYTCPAQQQASLRAGVYFLRITQGAKQEMVRVIKN